jgi:hypothetical protein
MDKPSHKYRTEIPNIIDDMDLSPYAFRLYVHIKRRAGDHGVCFENSSNLAKSCHMSEGEVSKCKKELKGQGLISIVSKGNAHFGKRNHHVQIINIWEKNQNKYQKSPGEIASSTNEVSSSPIEVAISPDELKNNSLLNNPVRRINNKKQKNELKDIPDNRKILVSILDEMMNGRS